MPIKERVAAALILSAVLAPVRESCGAAYRITDLGSLGGASIAASLNDSGSVVGWGGLSDGSGPRPFDYRGQMTDAGAAIPELVGRALSINNHGMVVGDAYTNDEWGFHAVRYENGNAIRLGTLGGRRSQARAINNAGQIVGLSDTVPPPTGIWSPYGPPPVDQKEHAFIYEAGAMHDLHVRAGLPGDNSQANALNDLGDVVGTYELGDLMPSGRPIHRAYVYRDGMLVDLGLLGGPSAFPSSINNRGQVVGITEDDQLQATAFLFDNGVVKNNLGSLGGTSSAAYDINDDGLVVGMASLAEVDPWGSPIWHAFLYEQGQMVDLNTLIPANSVWTLTHAASINAAGQIAGSGRFGDASRAFLLTPIPEPAAGALMALGGIALSKRRRSSHIATERSAH